MNLLRSSSLVRRWAAMICLVLLVLNALSGCTSATNSPASGNPTAALTATPGSTAGSTPTPVSRTTLPPTAPLTPADTVSLAPILTPTPAPIPVPTPGYGAALALAAACNGTPVPWATPYAGTVHPIVLAIPQPWPQTFTDPWYISDDLGYGGQYDVNIRWYKGTWSGPIQLVGCVDYRPDPVKIGSCGTYKRASDGVTGEVLLYRFSVSVQIVIARTGETLQSDTIYGSTPKCTKSFSSTEGVAPPWVEYGTSPDVDTINAYALSVSTQKVK